MKLSANRLKSIDWKQFAVNHGEKFALGVVGLMVVLILFMGTRWAKYREKDPRKLITEVETQSAALAQATWPDDQRELYTDKYNVNIVYDNTYSVVKADNFRYPVGHPMIWPLHRRREPIQEPTWVAVQQLVQTWGRFILELPPEGQAPITDAAIAIAQADEGPMSPEDARKAQFQRTGPGGRRGMGGFEGDAGGMFPGGTFPGPGFPGEEAVAGEETFPGDAEGMGGEMGGFYSGPQINARGVRFISVRGIFPYRDQLQKVMDARHDVTPPRDPRQLVDIASVEIQRQRAKPGPNPWSDNDDDWVTLDPKIALDLLAETMNYAPDIIDPAHHHWVMTMPLPARLVGSWTPNLVSHPDNSIKTLTERQLELRRQLEEQLVKMKQESVEDPSGYSGFALAQRNLWGIQNEVVGNEGMFNQLRQSMTQMYAGEDGQGQMPGELNQMLYSTEQVPEYLLFRYFDFDVEPGVAYRYRVRLKLFNPNFHELPDNLAAENVGTGEFRFTPWSGPPPPPPTPQNHPDQPDYELAQRDAPRARHQAKALVDIYQWIAEIGTTANKVVEVQLGQFIGQPESPVDEKTGEALNKDLLVEVLRPYESFKNEPLAMGTDDVVVDLAAPPMLLRRSNVAEFHSDLKVKELEPLSQMLTVNEYGELEVHNPILSGKAHADAKMILGWEHEPWEYLKKLAEQKTMMEEGMAAEGDIGMFIEEGMYPGDGMAFPADEAGSARGRRGRGRANPARRNREPIMP